MKKHFIIIVLAVFVPLFAAAQPVSLIGHLSGGYGGFPERKWAFRVDHYIGAIGADVKFDLNDNWSLLVGMDYQFRYMKDAWVGHYGNSGSSINSVILRGHYLRLPIRAEYDYKWFYAAAGPYVEKGFGNMPDDYELGICGANLELGGRINLNRQDHLRIGLLTSCGVVIENKPLNNNDINSAKKLTMGYMELNWLLRVGYEHRF